MIAGHLRGVKYEDFNGSIFDLIREERMNKLNKQTLQNRLHAAEQEIASVRKQLDELDAPKVVQGRYVSEPEEGAEYWAVWGHSYVTGCPWGGASDKGFLNSGNAFATKEAARKELSRRQAMQALRCCEGARGFVLDEDNFEAMWNGISNKWTPGYGKFIKSSGDVVYFDTREQALSAINSLTPEQQEALK